MISIITAIYNQRAVNELYWESLQRYTHYPFELIIIDNGSTDGSADFFESVGATVIRNHANFSYPYSQNQGIAVARYPWLAFLNNDIIVSPDWDKHMLASMEKNGLDVATVCGIEQVENATATKALKRRWKKIKNLLGLFGHSKTILRLMHKWMYGDWETFCQTRQQKFAGQIKEGFVGNSVVMNRQAIEKIGLWDERLQAADFDLYLRSKQRAEQMGDMKPIHLLLDVYNHHYIRLTAKSKYPPFADRANLVNLDNKWSEAERSALLQLNR
ncbi:MAG: glycosyltransferase [Gammaproteobacteria bacterium]|nr:glycosyltransferase [Gammaproteobacteria bacterium]MBU1722347.1 glycosyltransferase [Gammaproteobacteria bacterium]MBU2004716.1 glycosyltransferase [Gammaproteobacteria bacterium]